MQELAAELDHVLRQGRLAHHLRRTGRQVRAQRFEREAVARLVQMEMQSAAEQRDKAQGRAAHATSPESAASSHGRSRADDGFGVNQMIAEYRALRASVLRLWALDEALAAHAIDDMIRFNEAIDQAVAESLVEFSRTVESWRNVFLGALGHDLRGPLTAVVGTAEFLVDNAKGTPHARQAERILSGGLQLSRLVDGLLDYSKSALGAGMTLHRAPCDLGAAIAARHDPAALPVIQSWVQAAAKGEYLDGWAGRGGVSAAWRG